jgi:hypothetical protein
MDLSLVLCSLYPTEMKNTVSKKPVTCKKSIEIMLNKFCTKETFFSSQMFVNFGDLSYTRVRMLSFAHLLIPLVPLVSLCSTCQREKV